MSDGVDLVNRDPNDLNDHVKVRNVVFNLTISTASNCLIELSRHRSEF